MSNSLFKTYKLVTLAILSAIGIPLMFLSFAPLPVAPWLKFDLSDIVVYIAAVMFGPISAIAVALIKSLIHYFIKGSETGLPINQIIAFVASLSYAIPLYYATRAVRRLIISKSIYTRLLSLITAVLFLTLSISYTLAYWVNFILVSKLKLTIPDNTTLWVTIGFLPVVLVFVVLIFNFSIKLYKVREDLIIRVVPAMIGTISLTVLLTFLNYIWFTPLYYKLMNWPLPEEFLKYIVGIYGPFNFAKGLIISVVFIIISFRLDKLANALKLKEENNTIIITDEE